jgi:hypothetical protein
VGGEIHIISVSSEYKMERGKKKDEFDLCVTMPSRWRSTPRCIAFSIAEMSATISLQGNGLCSVLTLLVL